MGLVLNKLNLSPFIPFSKWGEPFWSSIQIFYVWLGYDIDFSIHSKYFEVFRYFSDVLYVFKAGIKQIFFGNLSVLWIVIVVFCFLVWGSRIGFEYNKTKRWGETSTADDAVWVQSQTQELQNGRKEALQWDNK